MNKLRRGSYRIGWAGIAVFAALMAALAVFCGWIWSNRAAGRPTVSFGYEWMPLHTDGMEPALSEGSLLLLLPAGEDLSAGEVIVAGRVSGSGGEVLRLLEADGETFLAKQDRLTVSEELTREQVTHTVARSLPLLGYLLDFLLTLPGLIFVIALPCAVFLLCKIVSLVRQSREENPQLEPDGDLRRKLAPMTEADEQEHFVDVTAEYTGRPGRKRYQSPLRGELEEADKFADLDFNPLMRGEDPSGGLERVEIPAETAPLLKILVDGAEAASVPLEKEGSFRVKSGSWRIDITVAQDAEAAE